MAWELVPQRVSTIVPTGPVTAWLLVPTMLAGGDERVAHGTMLVLLWVALLATVALAMHLGLSRGWAAAAGLLVAATPAVLGMTGTAMPDVPAMALAVLGIEQLVAWRQEGRWRQGIASFLVLGLAPMARTHLVLLFGIGALLLVGDVFSGAAWRAVPWKRWLPLAAAPLVTLLVARVTADPIGGPATIIGAATRFASVAGLANNTFAFLVHWVLALPLALPWLSLRWKEMHHRLPLLAVALAAGLVMARLARPLDPPWWLAPVAALGIAALADACLDGLRRRDGLQLTLWLWLLLALPTAIYIHLPSKYLLVSAPAAAILVARRAAEAPRLGRAVVAITTVAGVILGVAILRADAAFAGAGRTAARTLIAPQVAQGVRVWFAGHWGFQWYAEQAGARFFPVRPPFPGDGDLVVVSANSEPHIVDAEMEALVPIGTTRIGGPGGRVMDKEAGAGFYSNGWGFLPWSWGRDFADAFSVTVVRHPPEGPGR
jgi:4-amino-4-deoxy-L-arabinose transferase-like glycosyltransferase